MSSSTLSSRSKNQGRTAPAQKAAALLEVLGVFIAGNFLAACLGPRLGVKPLGALFQSTAGPDFIALSIGWFKFMCVQYACLLPPAFAIGWWRRRLGLAHYGITTARLSVCHLVALGLLVFALVAIPIKLLWVARHFGSLGPEPAYWAWLEKSWTLPFWLFLAVSSFAFTPMLEELFYRGYCQTRLEENFGGIGAIMIVTFFVTLGHNQYHHLNILNVGTMLSLIPLNLGMGYVYYRTRSLIPAMVLHGAVNLPTKGIYDFLLPAVMVAVLIMFRRKWLGMAQDFYRLTTAPGWKRVAFVTTLAATMVVIGFETWPDFFIPFGFLCLAAALIIEFRDRRLRSKK